MTEPCFCRICTGTEPSDARETKIDHDVAEFGWHVVSVTSDRSPDWAYSIGLWHTFRAPELALAGLPLDHAARLINDVGERIRGGARPVDGDRLQDLLTSGLDLACRSVDPQWYGPLFGQAIDFSQAPPLPFLQLVWPDRAGRFPWDTEFDPELAQSQPRLDLAPADHPMGAWSSLLAPDPWPFTDPVGARVVTTTRIAEHGAPVLNVYHGADGSWQFIDDGPTERADIALVHLGHVVGAHPATAELADLPLGWVARRSTPGDAWVREPFED